MRKFEGSAGKRSDVCVETHTQTYPSRKGQKKPIVIDEPSLISKIVGDRCESSVFIDGIETCCLLDSGSQVSTVSESFYRNHLANTRTLESLQQVINIEGAGGNLLPYIGYVSANVSFPGKPSDDETTECFFLVCPDTSFSCKVPVLMGTNVLCKLWPESVPLWTTPEVRHIYSLMVEADRFRDRDSGRIGSVKVLNHRAIIVKSGDTTFVPGIVRTADTKVSYPAVVQEPTLEPLNGGILVRNTLVTMPTHGKSRINVQVTNVTEKDIVIAPRSVIADLFLPNWTKSVGGSKKQGTEIPLLSARLQQNAAGPTNDKFSKESSKTSDREFLEKFKFDDSLSDHWRERAGNLLLEYKDVFAMHDMDIGCTDVIEHGIDLTCNVPFKERSRPIRSSDIEDARKYIQQLLDTQIIRESQSPYASPIVLVRKKNGDIRLTVDYRKLNKLTIRDAHALPRVEDAFTKLSGCRWFSTMDLKSGYYNVKVKEEDKAKTAFTCPLGFFEWNRMPQGVTNAPATFQRLMEKCLGTMNLEWAIAFLDDLIIFSKTIEEHELQLRSALQRLRIFGLKLSPEKCHFFQLSVSYLGHVVSELGIQTDPKKVDAVNSWPSPTNMKELRSFLGFLGYYRRFIKDFSKIAQPLNSLLKGYTHQKTSSKKVSVDHSRINRPFGTLWTQECEQAVLKLKTAITSSPTLAIADTSLPYELHTDASRSGLGAALYQRQEGYLRPIAFASRALSSSERNYPAHKLEFLALKWAVVDKFSDYLYGSKFVALTDNNPLTYVMTTAKLDATGQRWVAALATFDFTIRYIAGKKNVDADALSRKPMLDDIEDDWDQDKATSDLINRAQDFDCSSSQILSAILSTQDEPPVLSLAMSTSVISDFSSYPTGGLPIVSLSREELIEAQLSDPVVARACEIISSSYPVQQVRKEIPAVRSLLRNNKTFLMVKGLLYKVSKLNGKEFKRLVIPHSLKTRVFKGIHDDMGHLGSERSIAIARTRFYWVNMDGEITSYCKQCRNCILRKGNNHRPAPLCKLSSTGPMDLVCIDYVSVDKDESGKENILVVTDHFTRYARAFVTRKQTAKEVADMLFKGYFLDFGFPRRLHSDRGACFTGKLISQLKEITGVTSSLTTPYHPQGNGQCERFNRTLMGMLGTLDDKKKSQWSKHVKYLVHAYNCTANDSTSYSPFELMFGRQPRIPIDWYFDLHTDTEVKSYDKYVRELQTCLESAYKLAGSNSDKSHSRNKKRFDKRVRRADLIVGDRVLVRNVSVRGRKKLANAWCPDVYIVCRRQGGDNSPVYLVKREDGKGNEKVLHRNLLLPCGTLPFPSEDPNELQPSQPQPRPTVPNRRNVARDTVSPCPQPRPRLPREVIEDTVSEDENILAAEDPNWDTSDSDSSFYVDDFQTPSHVVSPVPIRRPPPVPLRRSTRPSVPPDRLSYRMLTPSNAVAQLLDAVVTLTGQH